MSPATHRSALIRGATVRFAERTVLRDATLAIGPHDAIAVVGDNGAGKSTLLGALAGTVRLAAGLREFELPGGLAHAQQHPEFPAAASVARALDLLLADLRNLGARVQAGAEAVAAAAEGERAALLEQWGALTERFEARGGYTVDRRVDAALGELGLGGLDRTRPVSSLSGGERARLGLAAALSLNAELLLLDEPTNHLDAAGLAWLEGRLREHRGAMVVVTHDRSFLDSFARDIIQVRDGTLRRFGNGYAGYLQARTAERARLLGLHEAWLAEVERQRRLLAANTFALGNIPRKMDKPGFGHGAFSPRGRDHGAAGRISMARQRLERLLADPVPRPAEPLRFVHDFGPVGPNLPLLGTGGFGIGRAGGPAALRAGKLEILPGQRWLVDGVNGAGKTTLLRVLAGELAPDTGTLWRRAGLGVAYLRQEVSPGTGTRVLGEFARATGTGLDEAAARLLGFGLFRAADLSRRLCELSVGQRRRLDVALVLGIPSDLLLLDEPANHLAPELVEELEDALEHYPGAVVTVTHERRWLDRAARAGKVHRLSVSPDGTVAA
ncbi:ATP-binding cassette domain-containing protein [Paeniglutamicibacter sp. R2-26]|uniref:ATP-binding cassette domain-containing protein n=1 Tax=Paeniglutamicibacter sp. R2-26 TaxID=3144417 RepID=UPI003EE5C165